jgi:hypothetical protein
MKKFEILLKITVMDDAVKVEVDNPNKPLSIMPPFDGPLSVTIDTTNSNTCSNTTWHGSEEMWYTSYKE